MAKIVRTTREGREEIELGSFQLTIGRRPENNIVIDNSYTAPRHAVVGFADGRHYIEDLKTSQGTRVNGSAVQQAPLRHGDTILIGLQRLEFVDPPLSKALLPPPAKPQASPVPAATPPATPPEIPMLPPLPGLSATGQPAPGPGNLQSAAAEIGAEPDQEAAHLLDQLVGSIRSHREREQQERDSVQARLRGEWDKTVAYAEQLKQKVEGDSRVHYFAISRRNNDVIVRAQRNRDLPVQFIQLSMEHPEDKGHALSGIWLRRSGQPDRCYTTAREALAELIRDLAFLIA